VVAGEVVFQHVLGNLGAADVDVVTGVLHLKQNGIITNIVCTVYH
jgi:hypothetical protein